MEEETKAVLWEAPEHHHFERTNDWYWALGIVALCAAVAAFFLGNFLLALLVIVGAFVVALVAVREPSILEHAVTTRGIQLGDTLYPYSTLESYAIDEIDYKGPQLLIKSKKIFMPLLIMPIPEEYVDEIDMIVGSRLEEEELEEPLTHKILEALGF